MKPVLTQQLLDDLYGWLVDCAAAGRPCPGNADIARRYEFASGATAAKAIGRLEKQGRIAVLRGWTTRQATITATGESTAAIRQAGRVMRGPFRQGPRGWFRRPARRRAPGAAMPMDRGRTRRRRFLQMPAQDVAGRELVPGPSRACLPAAGSGGGTLRPAAGFRPAEGRRMSRDREAPITVDSDVEGRVSVFMMGSPWVVHQ